jgi:DNA recombination protein RmuC
MSLTFIGILCLLLGLGMGFLVGKNHRPEDPRLLELTQKLAVAETENRSSRVHFERERETFLQVKTQMTAEFQNLAQGILESKSKKLSEESDGRLRVILDPLQTRLKEFQDKVDRVHTDETKERVALKTEVQKLMELNHQMSQETRNLTRALKGDSKVQGDWGELVLEKILESSGLRRDREYTVQEEFKDASGQRKRPDVVIRLPDDKHLIVDSKVSLRAYELYCQTEDTPQKAQHLAAHVKAIHEHIQELSAKHYARVDGVRSPDFCFMFLPIESAYILAMQADPELSQRAWTRNIAIVTATTLFTNLKTVASIWKLENQNRNAQEIAREGGRLYDKFVGFMTDFEMLGKALEKGVQLHGEAFGKLKQGPGNVFKKIEHLRELGANPAKELKRELLEDS